MFRFILIQWSEHMDKYTVLKTMNAPRARHIRIKVLFVYLSK